jgi:hypothetical protein
MELEDLFENKRNHRVSYRKHNYHGEHSDHYSQNKYGESYDSRHSYRRRNSHFDWMQVLTKINENRKLKMLVIIAVVVILILAISLVIALLPLLGKIFTFITQLDLKGLQDYITGLLAKILNG